MKEKKQAEPNRKRRKIFIFLSLALWLFVLTPFFVIAGMLWWASNSDLPGFKELENPKSNLATEIYSADHKLLGKYFRENRSNVKFDELSPYLPQALVATEDERYYSHSGVDVYALGRVAKGVLTGSTSKGGGSTVSQQLAKMLFSERSKSKWERVQQKFQEWIIASRIEKQYTKDEIVAMYFNKLDFVNNAVGIKSAAQVYFDSTPDSLKIEQAAMLVGMAKNPSLFNPIRRPDTVLHRRMVVLAQMKKQEMITQQEYDSLKVLPLGLNYKRVDHAEGKAPYFREILRAEVTKLLESKDPKTGQYLYTDPSGNPYNLYSDGLKIYTTIDSRMQSYAEWAVQEHMNKELQDAFFKNLKRWRSPPFSNDLTKEQIDKILDAGVKRSQRYRRLAGQECADCERPAYYINTIEEDGVEYFYCNPERGGCGHKQRKVPADSIPIIFDTPVPMNLFSYKGNFDTIMSPLDSIRYYKSFLQVGMMSMDPKTGFVKAWVGGVNYKYFQYDHVKQAKRQVGSTFKPLVYATAIREGLSPCHEVPNVPVTFKKGEYGLLKDWTPLNSDGDYGDLVNLRFGLANSMNTVTAWVMKQYGPESVIQLARDMGIKSKLEPVPSLCLGVADLSVYEMVGANATLANKGVFIEPIIITRIEDNNGNSIYDVIPNTNEAMDEVTAYVMLDLMKSVTVGAVHPETKKKTATGVRIRFSQRPYGGIPWDVPIAGKTGTTQNNSDGWFMGITPDLVTGVWVGAEDRSVRFATTALGQGANTALPIWGYYMNKVYADPKLDISKEDFEKPKTKIPVKLNCEEKSSGNSDFSDPEEMWR
jgi:penicillin-binding protein 1A